MRVPTRFLFETRKDSIIKNQTEVFKIQQQISSGLKLLKPSDAPGEFTLAKRIQVDISKLSRDLSDVNSALTFLRGKEEALSKVSDILAKAKLHAERGIDADSTEEMSSLASAVEELFSEAVEIANTSVAGRYIFGGSKIVPTGTSYKKPYDDAELDRTENWTSPKGINPNTTLGDALKIKEGRFLLSVFDPNGNLILSANISYTDSDTIVTVANKINTSGGGFVLASVSPNGKLQLSSSTPGFTFSITDDNMGLISELGGDGLPEYHGDSLSLSVEVYNSIIDITSDGRKIFGDPTKKVKGTLTILRDLIDILRFRKHEGSTRELLRSAVLQIEEAYELVNSERAKVGEKIAFLERREDLLNYLKTQQSIRKSNIEDLDMAEASVNLTLKESITQASMIAAVRAFELTILRFI